MLDEDKLKQVVADVLAADVASIGPDFSMVTVEQWDSLSHMTLVLAIEDSFGISIPDEEAANITTGTYSSNASVLSQVSRSWRSERPIECLL